MNNPRKSFCSFLFCEKEKERKRKNFGVYPTSRLKRASVAYGVRFTLIPAKIYDIKTNLYTRATGGRTHCADIIVCFPLEGKVSPQATDEVL